MTEINGHGPSGAKARNAVKVPLVNGRATYAEKHNIAAHFIGGNKLENAPESKVKDYVAKHDGHTVITNVSREDPLPADWPVGMGVTRLRLTCELTPGRF